MDLWGGEPGWLRVAHSRAQHQGQLPVPTRHLRGCLTLYSRSQHVSDGRRHFPEDVDSAGKSQPLGLVGLGKEWGGGGGGS